MQIEQNSTAFDVLAILYVLLDKNAERMSAIEWSTASEDDIRRAVAEYNDFLELIAVSMTDEYRINADAAAHINTVLAKLQNDRKSKSNEIYLLAAQLEHRLSEYSDWKRGDVIHRVAPLNSNSEQVGACIYPKGRTRWSQEKSERTRERTLNAEFINYMVIRDSDADPFHINMYYFDDTGLCVDTGSGWKMCVGLSPVMDNVAVRKYECDTYSGKTMAVLQPDNESAVADRIMNIFDELFSKKYSFIIFPEAIGTEELIVRIRERMREHYDYTTIVALPTVCRDGSNRLTVLGPGGVDCFSSNKLTPFIHEDKLGEKQREALKYDNNINLLITKELGIIAFPICADMLDPGYYEAVANVARADTIICQSFSPGINAFKDTMKKGEPLSILEFYVNTCSAKEISRCEEVPDDVAMVLLPCGKDGSRLNVFRRECMGECPGPVCYFDITVTCQNNIFEVEHTHKWYR